jgi:hypothetical protein
VLSWMSFPILFLLVSRVEKTWNYPSQPVTRHQIDESCLIRRGYVHFDGAGIEIF